MCAAKSGQLISGLHCFLQARPEGIEPSNLRIGDDEVPILRIPPRRQSDPLAISFEQLLTALQAEVDCLTELDGSMVWSGWADDQHWSLFGQVTDNGRQVLYVELRGSCPRQTLERLETILDPAGQGLMYQLPRLGIFVDRETLLRLAVC